MFLRFFITVILLSICDRVLGASVNVTDSLLTVKNATKLDNSTKPQNESALSNMKVRGSDLKLKKLGFNVTDALAVNSTLNSTSDSSLLKNASLGGRAMKVQHLLKHKIKANATHANVSNTSSHLNSTGNSTSDALQMKNASKIVERGVFVVMFDSKQALLDIANNTSEDASDASDLFSLLTNSSSVMNETESGKLLDGSNNSNSSASLGEL
ncbi:uncharacterized protein LOC124336453 isoform X3 [Daphnia pulicaria]|uniref:uncharacterized protein LOC124336453 isoform X3 n=1 Tax=Daphnia pulicaria TaxID=35523 RepID=UPI001EEAC7B6|nr:uncharacterized protein LOC124336453 isoform X3 [Daphnia pulicaria]